MYRRKNISHARDETTPHIGFVTFGDKLGILFCGAEQPLFWIWRAASFLLVLAQNSAGFSWVPLYRTRPARIHIGVVICQKGGDSFIQITHRPTSGPSRMDNSGRTRLTSDPLKAP